MSSHCIVKADVDAAYARVKPFVHRTPVLQNTHLCSLSGRSKVLFKCEALQKTGSFKFRGATNAVLSAKETNPDLSAVVTHSSGNHAGALALAGSAAGVAAHIIMPHTAPAQKRAAVEDTYKASVTLTEPTGEARQAAADAKLVEIPNSVFIHPSEDPRVLAGQGTVSMELMEQTEEELGEGYTLDVVIIPVGGGGLASGNSVALRGRWGDKVKIVLAEPAIVDDAKRSFESGTIQTHPGGKAQPSVADGLLTVLGPNTFPIIKDLVDDILTVSERDILACTKAVWERMKVLIEPSAGVGVAVLLSQEFKDKYPVDKFPNVGVVLCGGNVDVLKVSKRMEQEGI
jgi:threonine dehydratase